MIFLALALAATTYAMPDPSLTPGTIRPLAVQQICTIKWGKDRRHVTAKMKKQVCEAYKAENCPGKEWEIDHLISRELGGADDVKNLFPQPIKEAHEKDRIENWLHRQVCAGKISLEDAQKGIAGDWTQYLTGIK
jgi:hypothetical protein